jgi:hypothetical protein
MKSEVGSWKVGETGGGFPRCLFELTNAGKIFFTIFTALKKPNRLFFKKQPVLCRTCKKKDVKWV